MLRIRHILLPYDFSERGDATAPFVAEMARLFDARVTVLSVVPPAWQNAPSEPKAAAVLFDPQRHQAALDQALRAPLDGLKAERISQNGDPAAIITDFAHSRRADLIMMPTHGFGPFRSLLLGSVTAKVLHDARCPVWTAAHAGQTPEQPQENGGARAVLCAVDGTSKTVPLMKWAADWAEATGAELRFLHAVHSVTDFPMLKSERALQEQAREAAEAVVEKQKKEAGVDGAIQVTVGDVANVVRDEAVRCGAGLVLIGRGVLHGTLGRLRTHAYGIIRESPCPVLSV
jgi:nucleotide-binding universal stress UspA family protein